MFFSDFGNFRILSYNDKIMSMFCIPGNVRFELFDVLNDNVKYINFRCPKDKLCDNSLQKRIFNRSMQVIR